MNELIFPSADEGHTKAVVEASSRFVCFKLDGQSYGIAVTQVREVLRLTDIAFVPGAPQACRGVINLRGHIVSVLDLRQLLRLDAGEDTPHSRILVVDHPDGVMALQVDEVLDLLTVPDAQIEATPAVHPERVPVAGIVSRKSGPLFLLEPAQLLNTPQGKVAA